MFNTKTGWRNRDQLSWKLQTTSLTWSFIRCSFAPIYRVPSLSQPRSPMGWKQVAITFSHLWMVNSSNYKFVATELSAANCSFACHYQWGFIKYGNTITCQKVKIKWEKADLKNVWQTSSLINPGTPYWLMSPSVNISGRDMGFYNTSSKTSNTFVSTARKVLAFASRLWVWKEHWYRWEQVETHQGKHRKF